MPRPVAWLLALMLVCVWLAIRIHLVRRMEARRGPGGGPVPAWGWLVRLAHVRWILPLLAVLGVAFLAAAALVAWNVPAS